MSADDVVAIKVLSESMISICVDNAFVKSPATWDSRSIDNYDRK